MRESILDFFRGFSAQFQSKSSDSRPSQRRVLWYTSRPRPLRTFLVAERIFEAGDGGRPITGEETIMARNPPYSIK